MWEFEYEHEQEQSVLNAFLRVHLHAHHVLVHEVVYGHCEQASTHFSHDHLYL
jgi:hypothetical protein